MNIYKEIYKILKEAIKQVIATIRAYFVMRKFKKHLPKNWKLLFWYSKTNQNTICFWHHTAYKKDKKPSHVFKQLCDSLTNDFNIKLIKNYGSDGEKLETLQATGVYKNYGISIYQYQVDECTYVVEEVKSKKVVLTGDCVNF